MWGFIFSAFLVALVFHMLTSCVPVPDHAPIRDIPVESPTPTYSEEAP